MVDDIEDKGLTEGSDIEPSSSPRSRTPELPDSDEEKFALLDPVTESKTSLLRMSLLTASLQRHSHLTNSNIRLRAIYAWLGLLKSCKFLLSKPASIFIYSMLMYRLGLLMKTGEVDYEDLKNTFLVNNPAGLESIFVPLINISEHQALSWTLGPIATSLAVFTAYSAYPLHRRGEILLTDARLNKLSAEIENYLRSATTSRLRKSLISEYVLEITEIYSIGSKINTLKNALLWQGQLTKAQRTAALDLIISVAKDGTNTAQLTAIDALAEIAGSGVQLSAEDPRSTFITAEQKLAIRTLQELKPVAKDSGYWRWLNSIPRSLLAGFLLWAMNTESYNAGSSLFFLNWAQMGWRGYFLAKVIMTIQSILDCPRKPGFNFGFGYSDWSADYTIDCFQARVRLFRSIDPTEEVQSIQFSDYHLSSMDSLDLHDKYLTDEELEIFIKGVTAQGTQLTSLDVSDNALISPMLDNLTGLQDLTSLDLSHNNLDSLSDNFSHLPKLKQLSVASNPRITVIEDGDLQELPSLETFSASSCGISKINQPFSSLYNLQSLDLSDNPVGSSLSALTFKGLSQLSDLHLEDTQLGDDIDPELFEYLSSLQTLYLASNDLSALKNPALFSNLILLSFLDLSGNSLTSLHIDLFSSQVKLQTLYLTDNNLADLPDSLFRSTGALSTLDLSQNQFLTLSPDLSKGLTYLLTLSLAGNQFREFHKDTFKYLYALQSLDLSSNHMGLPSLVGQLPNFPITVRKLVLSYNLITAIPQNFTSMLPPGLEELDLSYNRFSEFDLTPDFTKRLPLTLTTLNLASINIKSVADGSFLGFASLNKLDISSNVLTTVSSDAFSNPSLQTLYLSHNLITNISESAFQSCLSLVTVFLDLNALSKIEPGTFRNLAFLQYLSIQNNKLTSMTGLTDKLPSLQTLIITHNQITDVPDITLSALQKLDLSYNSIKVLLNPFQGAPSLTELILSYNPLDTAVMATFNLPKLQTLEADSCQFNDMTVQNFTMSFPHTSLETLSLASNQIASDGMTMLSEAVACSELSSIDVEDNLADPETVDVNEANKILYDACDAEICQGSTLTSSSCITPLVPNPAYDSSGYGSSPAYLPASSLGSETQNFIAASSLPAGVIIGGWALSMICRSSWVKMLGKSIGKLLSGSPGDIEAPETKPAYSSSFWRRTPVSEPALTSPLISVVEDTTTASR